MSGGERQWVAVARALARDTGAKAQFVHSDVAGAANAVGARFDMVYTGVGAINWLPDLDVWAQTVFALLEPNGVFYIRDGHPSAWVYDVAVAEDGTLGPFERTYDYFGDRDHPLSWDEPATYTDGDTAGIRHTRHHEWSHTFAEIINALIGAGLVIDRLDEHRGCEWEFVPTVEKLGTQYFLPQPEREQVPLMFSLTAHRPAQPSMSHRAPMV